MRGALGGQVIEAYPPSRAEEKEAGVWSLKTEGRQFPRRREELMLGKHAMQVSLSDIKSCFC